MDYGISDGSKAFRGLYFVPFPNLSEFRNTISYGYLRKLWLLALYLKAKVDQSFYVTPVIFNFPD